MSAKLFIDRRQNKLILQIVASIMAIGMAGQAAKGQTTNMPVAAADSSSSTNVTKLSNMTVVGKLDVARNQIVPDLGATAYSIGKEQIASEAQGGNAPFNQVILRAPGVAQDSLGQVHLRGEHANLQYRINDVLLPEGITGFGQELDTRFVDSMQLITGSLPAQYGFRTAGIVDIHTKSGAFEPGGEVGMYGGSYDTLRPSAEYGGSKGNWNYFVNGSYDHNGIGIENPTSSSSPIHDDTDQGKAFAYASYILDDTSRISFMGSASYGDFELPNTPGLQNDPANHSAPGGAPWETGTFDSTTLNENQNEQNYYGVAAYQKSAGDFNMQIAAYGRNSSVHFTPDPIGDLYFNGVASDVDRNLYSGGLQADASYALNDKHTFRGGMMLLDESLLANTTTTVFNLDGLNNPTGAAYPIVDNSSQHAVFYGFYLQDEWKMFSKFTVNYGARFDAYNSPAIYENQISPRVNVIYKPTDTTTLHAGYARYFTPPPLENVSGEDIALFTAQPNSNTPEVTQADPVKSERSHYFDAGITQKITSHLQLGVDGYYKIAKNQLDDGFFGQSLILSSFNYDEGRVYGTEFTVNYDQGGFSAYANIAWSVAQGKNITSAQFLFAQDDLNYIQNNWVYLDHDQRITGSFGVAYTLNEGRNYNTRVYVDALYGSGLRTDAPGVPNGASVPDYYSVNIGAQQSFNIGKGKMLKARVDVVNLTDNVYVLRDGGGIGVNAAQYGMRLGVFGSVSYVF